MCSSNLKEKTFFRT